MSRLITLTIVIGLGWYLLIPVLNDRVLNLGEAPYLNPATRYGVEGTYKAQHPACRDTYVLAIATTGDWFQSCGTKETPGELKRRALDICTHRTGADCGIWVAEGKVTPFELTKSQLQYSRIYSASRIPFIRHEVRAYIENTYDPAEGHKALAISRLGQWGLATGKSSEANARAVALAECESRKSAAGKCFVYASGIQTEFTASTNIFPDRPR